MPPTLSGIPMVFDPDARLLYAGALSESQEVIGWSWGHGCSMRGGKLDTEIPALIHQTICFAARCDNNLHHAA